MKKFERIKKVSGTVGIFSIFAAIGTVESLDVMIPFGFLILGCASFLISKVCENR